MAVENSLASVGLSFQYDPAGKVNRKSTGRGFYSDTHCLSLSRRIRRTTPETSYSSRHRSTLPAKQ